MNQFFTISFLLIFVFNTFGQKTEINGYVFDKETNEALIGCLVLDKQTGKGTTTNEFGFFSKNIDSQTNKQLTAKYLGYKQQTINFNTSKDTTIYFYLEQNNTIKTITVLSENLTNNSNILTINAKQINQLPSLGGETDLIKVLQLLPGLQQGREGSSDLFVRGGSPDQNLILIDDVPIYYINHLGGFVSVFNPNIIKSIKLIKGGFPAAYGGRLSSVVDIKTITGTKDKTSGNISLGMLSSKLFLQGNLAKGKLKYYISARRMMYDLITRPISALLFENNSFGYSFYDCNTKFTYKINSKTIVDLTSYFGDDLLFFRHKNNGITADSKMNWGNVLTSVRFNREIFKNSYLKLLIAGTRYRFKSQTGFDYDNFEQTNLNQSYVNDIIGKALIESQLNNYGSIKFGYEFTQHFFQPGESQTITKENSSVLEKSEFNNFVSSNSEHSLFFQTALNFQKIKIEAGIRNNTFILSDTTFFNAEPRFSANLNLNTKNAIELSYASMTQNIHMLPGSGIVMPTVFWVPASKHLVPESSQIFTMGYNHTVNSTYSFSLASYYKTFKNLIGYKAGTWVMNGQYDWQNLVEKNGTGYAYGIELFTNYTQANWETWVSYSYSRSFRKFSNLNSGKTYPFTYDKPHNLNISGVYRFNKKFSISANWIFASAPPQTLAIGYYQTALEPSDNKMNYAVAEIYGEKNSLRLKPYHRLDISFSLKKEKKKGIAFWNFSIYNLYNRLNPYFYYYDSENQEVFAYQNTNKKLYQISFFPIIPSVSYSYQF